MPIATPREAALMQPAEFVADQSSSDISDQASATEELFLQQAKAQHALQSLQERLEAPDEDEEGNRFCLDCGDQIPAARLVIVPFAVRCVPCLSRKEQRRKLAESRGGLFDED